MDEFVTTRRGRWIFDMKFEARPEHGSLDLELLALAYLKENSKWLFGSQGVNRCINDFLNGFAFSSCSKNN